MRDREFRNGQPLYLVCWDHVGRDGGAVGASSCCRCTTSASSTECIRVIVRRLRGTIGLREENRKRLLSESRKYDLRFI